MKKKKHIAYLGIVVTVLFLFTGCPGLFGPPVYTSIKIGDSNAGAADEDGTIHVTFQGYYDPSSKLRYLYSDDGGQSWKPDDTWPDGRFYRVFRHITESLIDTGGRLPNLPIRKKTSMVMEAEVSE